MGMEGGRGVPVGEPRGLAGSMSSALEGSTHHLTATVIGGVSERAPRPLWRFQREGLTLG